MKQHISCISRMQLQKKINILLSLYLLLSFPPFFYLFYFNFCNNLLSIYFIITA